MKSRQWLRKETPDTLILAEILRPGSRTTRIGAVDEFVRGLKDIGIDKVLEMTTAAYQRQYR